MKTLSRPSDEAEILARLRSLRPDSQRRWGRMSAHQMVCHLADWSRMVLGQKPVSGRSGPLRRTALKWFALYAPVPWPPGIVTSVELDQERDGTRPVEFAADLAQAETLLGVVTAPSRSLARPPHPVFGPMSDAEWLRLGYLHTDHHLRQFGA
jgi:Protein of unknown function (DUF1569)